MKFDIGVGHADVVHKAFRINAIRRIIFFHKRIKLLNIKLQFFLVDFVFAGFINTVFGINNHVGVPYSYLTRGDNTFKQSAQTERHIKFWGVNRKAVVFFVQFNVARTNTYRLNGTHQFNVHVTDINFVIVFIIIERLNNVRLQIRNGDRTAVEHP